MIICSILGRQATDHRIFGFLLTVAQGSILARCIARVFCILLGSLGLLKGLGLDVLHEFFAYCWAPWVYRRALGSMCYTCFCILLGSLGLPRCAGLDVLHVFLHIAGLPGFTEVFWA